MLNARFIATVSLVAVSLLGCGDGATTDQSTYPSAPPASATEPSVTPTPVALCDATVMEDVVRGELDPDGAVPGSVEVSECQSGYARVFYRPESPNFETEQLFLRDDGGRWVIVAYGTGIDCAGDPDLEPPELEAACRALGLRQ